LKLTKRKKITFTLILAAIFIVFILMTVIGKSSGAGEEVTYGKTIVEKGKITTAVSGSGSLTSASICEIKSQANSEIESIKVNVGDVVEKGSVVAVINDDSAQTNLDKANNIYNQAVNEQTKIEDQLNNLNITSTTTGIITKLSANVYQTVQQGAVIAEVVNDSTKSSVSMVSKVPGEITKVNYKVGDQVNEGQVIAVISSDSIKESLTNQKFTVKEALLNVNSAKEALSKLQITAPQGGTVSAITLKQGDMAQGSIMTITNYDELNVVLPVDELDLGKIKVGQKANITSDIYKDKTFTGTIANIALEGVATNGVTTFNVTIAMDEKEDLKVGMTVNVEMIIAESVDVPIIPVETVQKDDKGYFVYKTSETDKVTDEILSKSKTYVEKGLTNDAYVEITKGLVENDSVIYEKAVTDAKDKMSGAGFGGQMMKQGEQGERPTRPTNNAGSTKEP